MAGTQTLIVDYLAGLRGCFDTVPVEGLAAVSDRILEAYRRNQVVAVAGNGGSSATASHLACDLGKTILGHNPADTLARHFRVLALTDNVPAITAWANDVSYESAFSGQLKAWLGPGDLLIVMSVSGNSPNIVEAVRVAKEQGATTIGFLGFDGGRLRDMVDMPVVVPSENYGHVEDMHMIFTHVITANVRQGITRDGHGRLALSQARVAAPKALVLAAGEGTRLRPLTLEYPKAMLPINGKPLLESTVEWLSGAGIREIAINLHHKPEAIVNHLGDGSRWNSCIAYSYEDPIMGTAGAVRKLKEFLGDGPFLVVYGDVLTDMDLDALLRFHENARAKDPAIALTMSLYHAPNPTEVGLVGMDPSGRITRFVEKPRPDEVFTDLASAGVLVAESSVIDCIPESTFYDFGLHLFPQLLEARVPMYGWVIPDRTYLVDIGTPEKYARAQVEWLAHQTYSPERIAVGR